MFETEERKLFNLSEDPAERNNLADKEPEKVAELDKRLSDYLTAVNANMPTLNPNYDPQARPMRARENRGKGGGGNRDDRGDRQNRNNRQNQRR